MTTLLERSGGRVRMIIAAAGLAGLTVTGCSGSTAGGGQSTPALPSSASSQAASTSVVTTATATATASSALHGPIRGLSQQEATRALLTAAEVGGGFARMTSDDSSNPLPCTPNDPPLDRQFSPSAKSQIGFAVGGDTAELSQEITVYPNAATVEKALAAGEKGLSCKTATINTGTSKVPVKITGPADLSTAIKLKVDKCEVWSVAASGVDISLIVAQVGLQLVVLTFSAQKGVDTSSLPPGQPIIRKALAKVQAAL